MQSFVGEQIACGDEFRASLVAASEPLRPDSSPIEAKACIELALSCNERMMHQIDRVNSKLQDASEEIDELRASLLASQELVMTDALTQVGNRRYFDATIESILNSLQRNVSHHFLVLVDLDEFKTINDDHGHAVGDAAIRYVATCLKRLSKKASVARYGGDEFAVFFECDAPSQAKDFADSVRRHFAATPLVHNGVDVGKITTSIGAAQLRDDDNQESWFRRADKLLYDAKRSGRNCAMVEQRKRQDAGKPVA